MTYDLINQFKDKFKDVNIVLDSYKLNSGIYYLFKKDGTFEKLEVTKETDENSDLYNYLKIRDLYSNYISSDKALNTTTSDYIDGVKYNMAKKICSNNQYTLFFKNKYLNEICNKDNTNDAIPISSFEKGIDKYFESLISLSTSTKKSEIMVLEQIKDMISTKEEILDQKENTKKAFFSVVEDLQNQDMPKEIWVKIFIDESVQEYLKASNCYLTLKIFNTNDNNRLEESKIYGLNNYNFTANAKKPYLELKTTSYKLGSLVDIEQINIIRNLYLWLKNNATKQDFIKIPIDFDFRHDLEQEGNIKNNNIYILNVINDQGNIKILDFDYASNYSTSIREFKCGDYINNTRFKLKDAYFSTDNIYGLEWYMNNVWIVNRKDSDRNYVRYSYYSYEDRIAKAKISEWKKEFLRSYNKIFFEFFHKQNKMIFVSKLKEFASTMVENTLIEDLSANGSKKLYNAIRSMNLWIAFDEYFNEKGDGMKMRVNDVKERVADIVLNKKQIQSDDEYYYLVGQVTFYLLSKSEAAKLTQDVTEPIIKSSSAKKVKMELQYLHDKYKHTVYLKDYKFNNIFSELMLKEPNSSAKEYKDILLAGLLSDNLFYTSNKSEEKAEVSENE